ncbi:ABC transporter substrate-binding protein [Caproiciproducens sp.]
MKRIASIVLVAALATSLFTGCGTNSNGAAASGAVASAGETASATDSAAAANGETIKVGAIYPSSGEKALLGTQNLRGTQIAVDLVNAKGGVNGKKIELVTADAPDATTATTEAGRLINQQGIKILFGSMSSGNAVAIGSVVAKSDALLIESNGIADQLTDVGNKHVFRIIDKGSYRGALGIQYSYDTLAAKIGKDPKDLKVAILNEDSSYGTSVAQGAVDRAKELGVNIVYKESYNAAKITDMSAMAVKVKKAAPDILISVSYINDAILLMDTLRQYQAVPKVIFGCGAGTTDPNFASTVGKDANGIFCMDMPTNLSIDVYNSDPELKSAVEEFRKKYLEMDQSVNSVPVGTECTFCGAYTFLNDILPKAKSLSADDLREAALSTKLDLVSLGFGLDFGEDGQNKLATANIGQWQDGKVITVYPDKLKNGELVDVPLPIASK